MARAAPQVRSRAQKVIRAKMPAHQPLQPMVRLLPLPLPLLRVLPVQVLRRAHKPLTPILQA